MSNSDVSLVSTKVKQEKEELGALPCGKQQQTDITDDHQRKTSTRRCHTSQTTTVKIAPRPANLQPLPSKEIITALPSPCIDMPSTPLTTLFPPPSTFLPGVDDNMTGSPLPFDNQLPFLPKPPLTATTNTNSYAVPPIEITNLPIEPLVHPDLSQVALLSAPPTHTQNDNQQSPATTGPGNLCDNDTMLKDLMAYYTPQGPSPPLLSRHKQTPLLLGTDPSGLESTQLKEKRADNRERKKRWREQNEERNKDNDLRCRVNKRAHNLFGREDNEAKRRWVENEFVKRQCRRRGKLRQMEAVDDVLSSTLALTEKSSKSPEPHKFADNDTSSGHLPILQDAYLSMLLNNMGSISPEASLKLIEGLPLMEATIKNEMGDREHALPQQLVSFLQQLQALHASAITPSPEKPMTTNEASISPSPSTSSPSTPSSPFVTTPSRPTIPPSITSPSTTPSDSSEMEESVGGIGTLIAPSAASSAASPQHIQPTQDGLSAMLIQSLQQTAVSYQGKQEYTMEPLSPATTEYRGLENSQQSIRLYSTEAVMKLMQMNLEWSRQ